MITYSLGFLVGSGQLITLVLQTTQLQFQFVQTTVQFVDGTLGLMKIIWLIIGYYFMITTIYNCESLLVW